MPANYVLLEKIVVGAAGASSITFSGIPQTGYTDLVVAMSARGSGAYNVDNVKLTANSITSYGNMMLYISGTSPASYSAAAQTTDNLSYTSSGNNTANTFGSMSFYFPNYTSSNNKSVSKDFVAENNSATVFNLGLSATTINSTAAITSLTLAPQSSSTWAQYSTFYLYGVAALGTTPAIQPYATGGDTIMTDGTYWYHAFLSSGTFTPTKALSCDLLVVAGGGGGGGNNGAGGGAGGLLAYTSQSIAVSAQTVTVGAGGTGGTGQNGTNGSNSSFASLTASVGGGGGATYINNGLAGGSGGGGGGTVDTAKTGGAGTSGQGNAGGGSTGGPNGYGGGGGGGAGAVGGSGNGNNGGNGGAGINTYSSWATTTGTGASGYYAGGGGGSINTGGVAPGTGGAGGGGNGSTSASGQTNGTANTGGGGGGRGAGTGAAANGGSGIVIVRYAV